jgi:hypothetical protein
MGEKYESTSGAASTLITLYCKKYSHTFHTEYRSYTGWPRSHRTPTNFSQSSSVALRGGALLNRSRNAAITWDVVCPVCCLSRTHTLATKRSSIESNCFVSAIRKTQLNSVAAANHVYTILHTVCQPTILHCTACCAVLCKLILSLRCVLSGCTVTSRPPWMLFAIPVFVVRCMFVTAYYLSYKTS